MSDANHPRSLPPRWREEADRLQMHADKYVNGESVAMMRARLTALRQCADELENRLLWSGMLEP